MADVMQRIQTWFLPVAMGAGLIPGLAGCAAGGGGLSASESSISAGGTSPSTTTTEADTDTEGDPSGDPSGPSTTTTTTGENETTTTGDPTTGGDDPLPGDRRLVIYQLVVRVFGNTNQTRATFGSIADNGVGKFADIHGAAIDGLRDLGITHVWLTGVLRQATLTDYSGLGIPADDPDIVKGRAGSFYAIRDYFDVSPDYAVDPAARLLEFDAAVDRLHAADLGVLIDLVPNHVARSYHSVVHPELDFGVDDDQGLFYSPSNSFFYLPGETLSLARPDHYNPPGVEFDGLFSPEDGSPGATPKVTGNNQISATPTATDWYETIKLNWGFDFTTQSLDIDPIPATWVTMDAIVAFWQARGVDGFRCDFAHFVPNAGWAWLIDQAKARDPEVLFIAEAYEDLEGLLAAGFDAVYFDEAYDSLKSIYQGQGSQEGYESLMATLDAEQRPRYLHYLENHDERRIASPVVIAPNPDDSGFGVKEAGYQLAPLAYLASSGPILFYNGQEVGDPGAGVEGFGQEDGRTTIFDYWSLPELSKWVNGGAYDGGGLAPDQVALREFYSDLLALAQDPTIRASGYWGLKYHNNPGNFPDCPEGLYSFARYAPGGGRVLVIVANFTPVSPASGMIRLPPELVAAAGLQGTVEIRRILDESGAVDLPVTTLSADALSSGGFPVDLPDQRAHVFALAASG